MIARLGVAMAKRKSISNKVRFEVFKRDCFTCQYCGRKAPDIVLNVDHVDPVAKGGSGAIFNLVTSCFDCNSGKSDRRLDDSSEVARQKEQLALIQERRNQLKMLKQWRDECASIELEMLAMVEEEVKNKFSCQLSDYGKKNFSKYIRRFGLTEVLECVRIASEHYSDVETALDKVPGIAVNRKREQELPGSARAPYVLAILKNRFSYVDVRSFWIVMNLALKNSVEVESVVEIAKNCKRLRDFIDSMDRYNEEHGNASD
jgi:hypothetical protein